MNEMITNKLKMIKSAYWLGILFIVILILLHFIKPELDPSWNFISEYQVGRYGWLMQVAFICLGLSCTILGVSLWKEFNVAGKIGLILLIISAVGMFIGGIFATDPLNTAPKFQTLSGKLHQIGAMLDQIPFAAIFITIALFKKKNWKIRKWLAFASLVLVWFGFIYFVGSIQNQFPADGKFGPDVLVGWQNRLMIITQALWIVYISFETHKNLNFGKDERF